MCECESTKSANLWLILIGLALGFVLFNKGK